MAEEEEARTRRGERVGEDDFTSWLLFVEDWIPFNDISVGGKAGKVDLANSNNVILEGVIIEEFNEEVWFTASLDGDGVVPLGVLTTIRADFTLDAVGTDEDSAIGVHSTEDFSVVGELSFNWFN